MQSNSKSNITPQQFREMSTEEKILTMASGMQSPAGKPQNEVLDSILGKAVEEASVRKLYPKWTRYAAAVAAVLIFLITIRVVPQMLSAQQLKTSYAETAEVVLPDGTEVTLNADSKLKWDKNKFNDNRYLALKGEAYFNVKKGDEFVIKTKNGTVEILGTQLNVFSRDNNFWVSCITGKVRVTANKQEQIITPGEWVRLSNSGLVKYKSESIINTISWKDGISHFEDTKLDIIFAELERQFDVSIKFEGNGLRKATIDFSNENLNDALDIVCIPMELSYEVKDRKIKISEKK